VFEQLEKNARIIKQVCRDWFKIWDHYRSGNVPSETMVNGKHFLASQRLHKITISPAGPVGLNQDGLNFKYRHIPQ
jgi:hypothetical protein